MNAHPLHGSALGDGVGRAHHGLAGRRSQARFAPKERFSVFSRQASTRLPAAAGLNQSWTFGGKVEVRSDQIVRQHLLKRLQGGIAHMTSDQAIDEYPPEAINTLPPDVPRGPSGARPHRAVGHPGVRAGSRPRVAGLARGYWPPKGEEADWPRWQVTIQSYRNDMAALEAMVQDPATDPYADLRHAPGHTVLHCPAAAGAWDTSGGGSQRLPHRGFAVLRRVMGTWRS